VASLVATLTPSLAHRTALYVPGSSNVYVNVRVMPVPEPEPS
jgi:hypothetical protein